ncbi:MAG: hypothetical protein NXI23_14495 [Bacteroidetes bacterium]|jgi:hypothetical protein|nr:hypothetical protein [Bacteroidota bacterium]MDF1863631.1 hypothetical protein [Saprospiraceae bacterium]
MDKLTPTTTILIIAAIGIAFFAYFYKKKKKGTDIKETENTPEAENNNVQALMATRGTTLRYQRTPVGFVMN